MAKTCLLLLSLVLMQASLGSALIGKIVDIDISILKGGRDKVPAKDILEKVLPILRSDAEATPMAAPTPGQDVPMPPPSEELQSLAKLLDQVGFSPMSRKRFTVYNHPMSFYNALVECKRAGMKLATIESYEDHLQLLQNLASLNLGTGSALWIAGTNVNDKNFWEWIGIDANGKYTSVGSSDNFNGWNPGYPQEYPDADHACIQSTSTGWQNLYGCDAKLWYVCEHYVVHPITDPIPPPCTP